MTEVDKSLLIREHTSSLEAAKIIQEGLLPKKRHFNRLFDESMHIYMPQNIISGDFYWLGAKHDMRYLVVGDCTGHGVAAALLSVLALNLFEYVIMNKGIKRVDKILQEVDKKFIESFKHKGEDSYDNPWIDLSLVAIDDKKKQFHYASGNRKMLHVSLDKEPDVITGCRYPIGGWQLEDKRSFEMSTHTYKTGDKIYMGSDGFQDQIGKNKKGVEKKFKSKNLHELLVKSSNISFKEQSRYLRTVFNEWKGDMMQTDDVCVVGVKL